MLQNSREQAKRMENGEEIESDMLCDREQTSKAETQIVGDK